MNYKVFISSDCHYCKEVLKLFIQNGIRHQMIVLESEEQIAAIKNKYNWSTIPIILEINKDGEKLIGGYEDTYKLLKEQKII
jgi:glutaredoxin